METESLTWQSKEKVRSRISAIDELLLHLLAERSYLACEIGKIKHSLGENLQDSAVEARKFEVMKHRCEELGLDFDYIAELWSIIMYSAKVAECEVVGIDSFLEKGRVESAKLRANLLELTKIAAPSYHKTYSTDAISAYRERELHALGRILKNDLPDHGLALDLGCATGQMTEVFEKYFDRVRAFDVSPHMCQWSQQRGRSWQSTTSFENTDLEAGIPTDDNSVSLVVANFGVASELGPNLLTEVKRVLKKGGKALLSFYNKDALLNYWFYPWPSTVRARLNRHNDTLEVWVNESVYTVQATGKTVSDLRYEFRTHGLEVVNGGIESYPTLQAIVPKFFFYSKKV
jgi:chorismate mutase/ubiquinone/menaquinone biosynthesis C-methylase UbiE